MNEKHVNHYTDKFKRNWKRFLDDCFISWFKSKSELVELKLLLNNLHPDIKFTMEYGNVQQQFWDVLVKREGTKIVTDICYKPIDSKQYLLFNSCHPKLIFHIYFLTLVTKPNIPFSLARRIKSIVTNGETLKCAWMNYKQPY